MTIWLGILLTLLGGISTAQETSTSKEPPFPRLVFQAQREKNLREREAQLQRARRLAEQNGNLRQQGIAWQQLGRVCLADGLYRCALERYQRAAQFLRRARAGQQLALLNNEFGLLLFEHGKYLEAQQLLQEAVVFHRERADQLRLAMALPGLALVNAKLGQRAEALSNIAETPTAPAPLQVVHYGKALLGNAWVELGRYDKAIELLAPVLRSRLHVPFFAYRGLAAAYYHAGRDADVDGVVAQCLTQQMNLDPETEVGRRQSDCLYWRARSFYRRGDLDGALKDIQAGLAAVESMRSNLVNADLMKRDFDSSRRQVADLAIEVLFAGKRFAEALQVAEQWRARAFLDLLASQSEGEKPRLLEVRHPRMRRVLHLASEPPLASGSSSESATSTDIAHTATRLQSVVLSYWTTPGGLYLWLVMPSGQVKGSYHAIPLAELEGLISRTQSWKTAADRAAWRRLYDLLIAPLQSDLPKESGALLTLVPHGPLLNLSFAALLDRGGRYLLERYALHYTPAAALLDFTMREQAAGPMRVLAVGNPKNPALADGRPLAALAGSRQEIAAIAAAVPAARLTRVEGAQVLPATITASVAGHDVLHFATHSVVDADEPFQSFLALSEGQRLTAGEIYDLDTKPSLVVLSACRSAAGQVSADGVLGLTRAFFYAGAASIIASVWEVPDQTAPRLAAELYRSLEKGQSRGRALRAAQLSLLRNLRNGKVTAETAAGPVALEEHPALWAGFLLQGEP
ncbi:MAG: CHAT domain-containing protein [Bryobacterales bacterium]|nr:CHAT domain-containing protein [Bryobacterales bacterium]